MDKYQNIRNNIIDKYSCLVDDENKFADSINIHLKQSFRVNTLKEEKKTVINKLKEYDPAIKTTEWNDNAHISELNNLGSSLEHFVGQIYIQELTSMIPPLVVKDLIKDIKVIDCCAAPGSKTTQIAAMMENKGHIIANDARHARLKSLRGNLDRLGVTNTSVTLRDFKSFPNTKADLYFVDAPCSSEGTIRKKNTVARTWKENDYLRFNKLQNGLLSKACEMAPSGSTIVYSTCTFSPDENEKVVSETLDKYDLKMKNISIENLRSESGITEWNNESYNSEVKKCMRVWPHHNDTDAFFIARMEKC